MQYGKRSFNEKHERLGNILPGFEVKDKENIGKHFLDGEDIWRHKNDITCK
jgi:hypothetical protein